MYDHIVAFHTAGDRYRIILPSIQQASSLQHTRIIKYPYHGEFVCQQCFCDLYNINKSVVCRVAAQGDTATILHRNKFRSRVTVNPMVHAVVEQLVQRDAQHAPHTGMRTLPQGSWKVCIITY